MQTPTTQRKPKARTLTADSKLPYPKFPRGADCNEIKFWLPEWFREQAEFEEVKKIRFVGPAIRQSAMFYGGLALEDRANKTLDLLKFHGGLLFAWAGTTHPAVRS